MNTSSSSAFEENYIPPTPHQPGPSFKFPKHSFGKTKIVERSFQQSWFAKWPFLHYDENCVCICIRKLCMYIHCTPVM